MAMWQAFRNMAIFQENPKMSSRPGVSPEISLHSKRSTLQIQKAQTCPMPWQTK